MYEYKFDFFNFLDEKVESVLLSEYIRVFSILIYLDNVEF